MYLTSVKEVSKNKKNVVYNKLREQIIKCVFPPGMPINEAKFAEIFGVSKTPIREAIRQLEREGLVDNIPGRGSIISNISSKDIIETFEIREIIECGVAKKAVMLKDKKLLIRKREEIEKLRLKKMNNKYSVGNWIFCDDIHLFLVDLVDNKKLSELYREILDTIERIRNNFIGRFEGRRLDKIIEEHLEILDAVIEGNADIAQQKVQEHLSNAYKYLVSLI